MSVPPTEGGHSSAVQWYYATASPSAIAGAKAPPPPISPLGIAVSKLLLFKAQRKKNQAASSHAGVLHSGTDVISLLWSGVASLMIGQVKGLRAVNGAKKIELNHNSMSHAHKYLKLWYGPPHYKKDSPTKHHATKRSMSMTRRLNGEKSTCAW
ncbi:uncharacterized protein PGTG_07465 [Puccinia graminis f. sp. tritici CRL 75-36-700-3]|uniref:Uncharacterized protein n=1 Tax=Puccinia graminis f. sp. tritici (strain CRL 75-36-700-3 / race SCCL) TaxID=418459 RepID=E3KD01_PUCGT|nr:uncharacterized protein PGTG_07465 [Puccinia graminis f. sp. tritici CRL 75-36-700-3]EFP82068.1 hypothetical protein PGTG_07465 [Puccinia graminis f. sp. tritici CRL 75-36-700-3]